MNGERLTGNGNRETGDKEGASEGRGRYRRHGGGSGGHWQVGTM